MSFMFLKDIFNWFQFYKWWDTIGFYFIIRVIHESYVCIVVNGTRKAVHGNVMQRCGSCTTLPNVIQRYGMLSHRCQTLSNVVTKLYVVVSKLCNVSSCTTLPLPNAVQRCYSIAKRYTTLCNVVTTLPNVIISCATLLQRWKRYTTLCNVVTKLCNVPRCQKTMSMNNTFRDCRSKVNITGFLVDIGTWTAVTLSILGIARPPHQPPVILSGTPELGVGPTHLWLLVD